MSQTLYSAATMATVATSAATDATLTPDLVTAGVGAAVVVVGAGVVVVVVGAVVVVVTAELNTQTMAKSAPACVMQLEPVAVASMRHTDQRHSMAKVEAEKLRGWARTSACICDCHFCAHVPQAWADALVAARSSRQTRNCVTHIVAREQLAVAFRSLVQRPDAVEVAVAFGPIQRQYWPSHVRNGWQSAVVNVMAVPVPHVTLLTTLALPPIMVACAAARVARRATATMRRTDILEDTKDRKASKTGYVSWAIALIRRSALFTL